MPDEYRLAVAIQTLEENIEPLKDYFTGMTIQDATDVLGLAAVGIFRDITDLRSRARMLDAWLNRIRTMAMENED